MPHLQPTNLVMLPQLQPAQPTSAAPLTIDNVPSPIASSDQVQISAPAAPQSIGSVSVSFQLQYFQHTVKRGDNLSSIAKDYLGDPNKNMEIFKANREALDNPDGLRIGMQLRIPVPAGMSAPVHVPTQEPVAPVISPDTPMTQYTVRRGDNLSSIALDTLGDSERYMSIFNANRHLLKDPDALQPGMVLKIPGGHQPVSNPQPAKPTQPTAPVTPTAPSAPTQGPAVVDASGLTERAKGLFTAMQNYQRHHAQLGNTDRTRTTQSQLLEIARELDSASQAFGVDPKMMLALYAHESGGINPRARSHTGAGGLGQLTSIAIRQVHFMAGIGKGRTGVAPYSQHKENFIQSTRSINQRYDIKANVWTSVAYMSYELNGRAHLGRGTEKALKRYGDPNVSTYANKVNAEYKTLFGGKIF